MSSALYLFDELRSGQLVRIIARTLAIDGLYSRDDIVSWMSKRAFSLVVSLLGVLICKFTMLCLTRYNQRMTIYGKEEEILLLVDAKKL